MRSGRGGRPTWTRTWGGARACVGTMFETQGAIVWPEVRAMRKRLAPHAASSVIKTFVNAWTTSFRMSEPIVRLCLFGCRPCTRTLASHSFFDAARDTTEHYLVCPILWKIFAPNFLDANWTPVEQCGVLPVSKRGLKNAARFFCISLL